jgi:pyruvate dehydrogenase E1 component subunit alpha
MAETTLATFSVTRLEILDTAGRADPELLPDFDEAALWRGYRLLALARTFDERALSLQREGRLGTYPSILGQEAAQVGSALALEAQDWVFPAFREMGVFIALGYPMALIYRYWAGDERGLCGPPEFNIFPISIAVGTHVPHAVGAALAAQCRGDKAVMVCYLGDGGTSKGDFHEGLNFAGVFKLPVVFIVQNNQWAISVPRSRQSASLTLAQKAVAYGFPGVQVDGNDLFAVYRATAEALRRARSGDGPTLIECDTYRMADHTTADDARRYRSEQEVASWRERDPLLRLRRFLAGRSLWSEEREAALLQEVGALVDAAVAEAEAAPPAAPAEIFDSTCAELSPRQRRQRQEDADGDA